MTSNPSAKSTQKYLVKPAKTRKASKPKTIIDYSDHNLHQKPSSNKLKVSDSLLNMYMEPKQKAHANNEKIAMNKVTSNMASKMGKYFIKQLQDNKVEKGDSYFNK